VSVIVWLSLDGFMAYNIAIPDFT